MSKKNKNSVDSVSNQSNTDNLLKIPQFVAIESIVGAVMMLAMKSQAHKYFFASDFEPLIFPPIAQKQFILFRSDKNEPLAFITWANVSEEVEKRMLSGVLKLQPQDWNSGDRTYIMDAITPLSSQEFLKRLQERKFEDKNVKMLKPKSDGKGFESVLLKEILK